MLQKQFLLGKMVLNGELFIAFYHVNFCMNSVCGTTHHIHLWAALLRLLPKHLLCCSSNVGASLCFQAIKTINW